MSSDLQPQISDEDVQMVAEAAFGANWSSGSRMLTNLRLETARRVLERLVASGWRREADVRREVGLAVAQRLANQAAFHYPVGLVHSTEITCCDRAVGEEFQAEAKRWGDWASALDQADAHPVAAIPEAESLEPEQPIFAGYMSFAEHSVSADTPKACATGLCRGTPVIVMDGEPRCSRCAEVITSRRVSAGTPDKQGRSEEIDHG